MDAGYQVELDVFEGPLDLLLHLVKKGGQPVLRFKHANGMHCRFL